MNLDHLYYFRAVVETGSRTEAADQLAVTPSTLSLAITKLERELGTVLFQKTRGSVELTADGEVFYEYASTALRFLEGGVRILRERREEEDANRQITIGAVYSVQDGDWSRIINQYRQATHGEVQINVKQSTTPWLIRNLKKGVIDVAFAGTMGPDAEIVSMPCWSQSAVLVVNKLHPLASRSEVSLSELNDHYLVSYSLTGPLGQELTDLVRDYDLTIDHLYSDEITLASIVVGNPDIMAIACRSWLLDAYSNEVALVRIVEAPVDFHQMYLMSRAGVSKPYPVAAFIEAVKSYCAVRNG